MTSTYNPIIAKEEVPRLSLFRPRPAPEPGIALVLFRSGQNLITLWPGDRLTAGEVRWGNYKTLYKVDVAEHTFRFTCNLPCDSDAFDFHAAVQATYSVSDPAKIVENKAPDARDVLEPLITDTMRNISRRYDVENSAEAELAIAEAVKNASYDVGFRISRFVVKLNLDEDARAYIRDLREIERNKVRAKRGAELTRVKMELYDSLIQAGNWQLLALQLTNHPDDVPRVLNELKQQRKSEREDQLRALEIMLDKDALEGFQLEDSARRVLGQLVDDFQVDLKANALDNSGEQKLLTDK